jgi:hypothetical protein
MNHLREQMDAGYGSHQPDLADLADRARNQGARLRRRQRRLTIAGGALAVLAAFGAGPALDGVVGHRGEASDVRSQGFASAPHFPAPVPAMDALTAAIARVVPDGTISDTQPLTTYEGDAGDPYAKGALKFAAPGAAGAGWVSLNVFSAPEDISGFGDCGQYGGYPNCEVSTLEDGSLLVTWDVPVWNGPSESKRLGTSVAGVLVSNGMVVSVDARIPFADEKDKEPLSPDAPLTTAQLREVLSQPEWTNLLPLQ